MVTYRGFDSGTFNKDSFVESDVFLPSKRSAYQSSCRRLLTGLYIPVEASGRPEQDRPTGFHVEAALYPPFHLHLRYTPFFVEILPYGPSQSGVEPNLNIKERNALAPNTKF